MKKKKKRETWVRVWPPLKVVENPDQFLIEEEGCPTCKDLFGWVACRKGQYNNLELIMTHYEYAVGYWNASRDTYHILHRYKERKNAEKAIQHLQIKD
jgi:hypothetical protein